MTQVDELYLRFQEIQVYNSDILEIQYFFFGSYYANQE